MKKSILLVLIMILFGTLAYSMELTPQDLNFVKNTDGKFIYCNNPEGLTESQMANASCPNPAYIMNNEDMTPSKYQIYLSHFNVNTKTNSFDRKTAGDDMFLDVEFVAKEDSKIIISSTAFQIPEDIEYYQNKSKFEGETSWSSLQGIADLMGDTVRVLNRDLVYYPKKQKTYEIEISTGESFDLSDYIDNYSSVPYPKHVFMASDFEIVSGLVDINVYALKAENNNSQIKPKKADNCAFGRYLRDRTTKGVADCLPYVDCSLEYTIDDTVEDGTFLPVRVFNQYAIDGNVTNRWCTNLSPQDDIYSKTIAAESDMLSIKYKDDEKLSFYGSDVPEEYRDNIYVFDPFHSDTKGYEPGNSPYSKNMYSPNYALLPKMDNSGYACSLGNYGVYVRYHVTVNNLSDSDRFLDFLVNSGTDVLVRATDKEGNTVSAALSKGITEEMTTATMASLELPKNNVSEYIIELTLPVQNYGGPSQSFQISSKKTEHNFDFGKKITPIKFDKEVDSAALLKNSLDKDVIGNLNNYEIQKCDDGYVLYNKVISHNPYYYSYLWEATGNVYVTDKDFNIKSYKYFNNQPTEMSEFNNVVYIKTKSAGSYKMKYGEEPEPYYEGIPKCTKRTMIRKNDDNEYSVSFDGTKFYKIDFQALDLEYVDSFSDMLYYAYDNHLGASCDGIYWSMIDLENDIKNLSLKDNTIKADNDKLLVEESTGPYVVVNDEILAFDTPPVIRDDRTLVPIRFILEKFGMNVSWNDEERLVEASNKNTTISFKIDDNIAYVNGVAVTIDTNATIIDDRTFIPLRFLSESLGYTVTWDEIYKIAKIK